MSFGAQGPLEVLMALGTSNDNFSLFADILLTNETDHENKNQLGTSMPHEEHEKRTGS